MNVGNVKQLQGDEAPQSCVKYTQDTMYRAKNDPLRLLLSLWIHQHVFAGRKPDESADTCRRGHWKAMMETRHQPFPHTPTHRSTQPDELLLTAGAADDSHYASDRPPAPTSSSLAFPDSSVGEHSDMHL